jgi:GDP-L-fucose synthase
MDIGKKILITGGKGFLGRKVVKLFEDKGYTVFAPSSKDYDLTKIDQVQNLLKATQPDIIVHLAAKVGGIGANKENPASFFYDNLIMGVNLLHEAHLNNVQKFVTIGTVCSYPKYTKVPFKEENLWLGYPEETNAPYGIAKKSILVMGQAYREQYGFNSIFLMPTNLYGDGDNFDPKSSHVIPALIKKIYEAKQQNLETVEVWGDGSPTREFLFVDDAALGIFLATENYNEKEPVNLGSEFEINIFDLVYKIIDIIGYDGKILWNTSKPNGQPRRKLDSSKAKKFGFKAKTTFEEGLKKTIDWYIKNDSKH